MTPKRILLVEDDSSIAELLADQIAQLGYSFAHEATGDAGLERALAEPFALIILDHNLPGLGGLEILRELRKRDEAAQIIMLTSKGSELDRVLGLELGADDYIVKPFSVPELVARIRSRLRQAHALAPKGDDIASEAKKLLRFAELTIDIGKREVAKHGESIELTTLEFDVILFLASHPGKPFTRDELMQHVWGYCLEEYETNVNSTISRIRRKIESDFQNPQFLLTVRGLGYKWCDSEVAQEDE